MRRVSSWSPVVAILVSAVLLLWPAILNGYPLLFGDTGVYVKDGIDLHVSWPRPLFYGLFMRPLHLKTITWPVVIAQALITSTILLITMRAFVKRASSLALIPICLVLTIGTSLPWFVSQLMPDLFAGLMILMLATMLMVPHRLSAVAKLAALLFAAFCITVHLSLVPISLAVIVTLWAARLAVWRRLGWGNVLRGVAVPALAAAVLIATNAVLIGIPSMSPYGKIFVLNRLLVDGPGLRALERECPRPDWTLCAFTDEIPTIADEDDMLWGKESVLDRAGGYKVVAPQAWPIVLSALRAEPSTVILQALRNTAMQFVAFRTGDALMRPSSFNDGIWRAVFPPAEQARYHAGRQYRGIALVPDWLQFIHVSVAAASIVIGAAAAVSALRRREPLAGLLAAISVALLANAFVAGALSGVYDRYQSRLVWLAPFGVLLIIAMKWNREDER